jgi:hypothetical protein
MGNIIEFPSTKVRCAMKVANANCGYCDRPLAARLIRCDGKAYCHRLCLIGGMIEAVLEEGLLEDLGYQGFQMFLESVCTEDNPPIPIRVRDRDSLVLENLPFDEWGEILLTSSQKSSGKRVALIDMEDSYPDPDWTADQSPVSA